jgi:hypothetical protein
MAHDEMIQDSQKGMLSIYKSEVVTFSPIFRVLPPLQPLVNGRSLEVDALGSLDDGLRGFSKCLRPQHYHTHSVWDTGQGEAGGELHDVLLELGDELGRLTAARLEGLGEVLEELGSGLLLRLQGDLDDSVEELGDLLQRGNIQLLPNK